MMWIDDDFVTRAVFHPRPELHGYLPVGVATTTPTDDAEIAGYVHENQESNALLVFFHGNGEIAADYDSLAEIYTACGASCWIVDYRGYGRSTGTPSFSHMFRDAEAVLEDVPRIAKMLDRDFAHVIVMGRSLGSASAIHLASRYTSSLAGLVLDSPYADGPALIARLGCPASSGQATADFEDNQDKIGRCHLPTLIIHGTSDRIIPVADARLLYERCPAKAKKLIEVEAAGHNDLLVTGFAQYCTELREHIARTTTERTENTEGETTTE